MSLDDLLESIREDEFISPKAAAGHKKKIKAEKFFNLTQEIRAEGTLGGKALTPQQRKVGFKAARGGADSVDWKNFLDQVEDTKAAASEGITSNTKMLPAGKSVLEEIATNVKSILGIIDARTEAEEDAADELKQEGEKDKRKKKEEGKEKDAKKGMKIPGFITKAAAPITNIWGQIVKTFGVLLAGWGIDKIFKWLRDPKNEKAVEELKEFITVAAPAIIKGILAYVALDIGLKVVKFAAMLAKGSLTLLGGLRNLTVTLGKWAIANPQVALAIGLGALLVGGGIAAHNQIKENRQAFDEQDDDSTLTVEEFSEQEDKSKVDIKPGQAYSEVGTFPGMTLNKGGQVPGSGNKDTVPAMLTPGEFVMSKGAVQKYGVNTMESMNAAAGGTNRPTMGRYETGGLAKEGIYAGMSTDEMMAVIGPSLEVFMEQNNAMIDSNPDAIYGEHMRLEMDRDGKMINFGKTIANMSEWGFNEAVRIVSENESIPPELKHAFLKKMAWVRKGTLDNPNFKSDIAFDINKDIPGTAAHRLLLKAQADTTSIAAK